MSTDATRAAAELLMAQGLVMVPYEPRSKKPVWNGIPDADDRRVLCRKVDELEPWLRKHPDMNLAVLGAMAIDADSAEAQDVMRDMLGVSRELKAWFMRSSKGWKAVFRPPAGVELRTATKAGCHCPAPTDPRFPRYRIGCPGWRHSDDPKGKLDLDFIAANQPLIVPPSVHPTGRQYAWAPGHGPEEIPFAELAEPPALAVEFWKLRLQAKVSAVKSPIEQSAGFYETLKATLAARTRAGTLPAPSATGWQGPIPCPFPAGHKHGDERSPSFTVNFRLNVWKCHASCGAGTLVNLAERLNIPITTVVRNRGGGVALRSPVQRVRG